VRTERDNPVSVGFGLTGEANLGVTQRVTSSRGFSLVELLVVIAVCLIVMAFATPITLNTMDAYKLRWGLTNATGLVQRCRLEALKKNTSEHIFVTTSGNQVILYCKAITDTTLTVQQTDPQVLLPSQFSIPGLPTGGPTQLTATVMWGSSGSSFTANSDPYFNSRGLPCAAVTVGSACTNITGNVYYLKYTSRTARWTALSISPAGRIQNWYWDGGGWEN